MTSQENIIITLETCSKCGSTLKDDWQFCPYCKTKSENVICPNCLKSLKKTWEFCPFCKHKIKIKEHSPAYIGFDQANEWLKALLGN